ncbi:MAG: isoprenylcysteine carboxylmethyltransferase family protein [Thermoanaerobaculia bacterium]|nr:isoprenylcysteine carboxylmethyltransferase family protein [Thermoanaerobaculia bacterium]
MNRADDDRPRPAERSDGPGVWFPPPLVYLLAFGLFYGIHRAVLPIGLGRIFGGDGRVAAIAGACVVGLGLALDAWSLGRFWRAGTSALPFRPASSFVAVGPYRFTRNPMYLGITLVVIGLGFLLDSAWVLLAAFVGAAMIHAFVIPREERYLERRFGASYLDYTRRVRRWL